MREEVRIHWRAAFCLTKRRDTGTKRPYATYALVPRGGAQRCFLLPPGTVWGGLRAGVGKESHHRFPSLLCSYFCSGKITTTLKVKTCLHHFSSVSFLPLPDWSPFIIILWVSDKLPSPSTGTMIKRNLWLLHSGKYDRQWMIQERTLLGLWQDRRQCTEEWSSFWAHMPWASVLAPSLPKCVILGKLFEQANY